MTGIIIGLIFFLLTIPIRSAILILQGTTKTTELLALKRYVTENKNVKATDVTINSKANVRSVMTNYELALYMAQKALIRTLKVLLAMVQWLGRLLTSLTVLIYLVIFIFIVALVASMGSLVTFITDSASLTTDTWFNPNGSAGGTCESRAEEYMNACTTVWKDWSSKGYDYSQSVSQDSEYGTIRTDCSGYVFATLQELGEYEKPNTGTVFYTGSMSSYLSEISDLEKIKYEAGMELVGGDILVIEGVSDRKGHTQVYMGNGLYYSNGSSGSLANPEPSDGSWFLDRMATRSDAYVWRWKRTNCIDNTTETAGSNQEIWINTVLKTQKIIASYKFTYSNPSSPYYRYVEELGTYMRPDCSGVVYACAQQLGAYDLYPSCTPATIFGTSIQVKSMTETGYFELADVRSESELQPGDIVVGRGHTQIFMGDGLWVNGGNTEDLGEPNPVPSSYFPSGCKVLRVRDDVEITPRI